MPTTQENLPSSLPSLLKQPSMAVFKTLPSCSNTYHTTRPLLLRCREQRLRLTKLMLGGVSHLPHRVHLQPRERSGEARAGEVSGPPFLTHEVAFGVNTRGRAEAGHSEKDALSHSLGPLTCASIPGGCCLW